MFDLSSATSAPREGAEITSKIEAWTSRSSTWFSTVYGKHRGNTDDVFSFHADQDWCDPVLADAANTSGHLYLSGCHMPNGPHFVKCTLEPFTHFYPAEEISFAVTIFAGLAWPRVVPWLVSAALFCTSDVHRNVSGSRLLFKQNHLLETRTDESNGGGYCVAVTSAVARQSEGEYLWKLLLLDSTASFVDEIAIPIIISDSHEPPGLSGQHCTDLKCTEPAVQFFTEHVTAFNPFLQNTSLYRYLPRFPDRDLHRRLNNVRHRASLKGTKARVIFTLTSGRTGTTYLASLIASTGKVLHACNEDAHARQRGMGCVHKVVVTHDSAHCIHRASARTRTALKLHEILSALESALAFDVPTPVYAECSARFVIDCTQNVTCIALTGRSD